MVEHVQAAILTNFGVFIYRGETEVQNFIKIELGTDQGVILPMVKHFFENISAT